MDTKKENDIEYQEFFDNDGKPIKALSQDKAQEILSQLKEKQSELEKLKNKDYNFKQLRDAKSEEREKLLAKLDEKDQALYRAQLENEQKVNNVVTSRVNDIKEDVLSDLVGDDEDLRKKVLYHYDRLSDNATSKTEIKNKIRDAYKLASDKPANDISRVMGTSNKGKVNTDNSGAFTEAQRKAASKLGLSEEDLKAYEKEHKK